jgi:DNA-binding LacI/PurR family transcriptional regulator/signal transduction histidine kinase/ActR/RegA family two-component response regulator
VLIAHIDRTSGGYESELRAGFEARCRNHDLNLLVVAGLAPDDPRPEYAAHNGIYDLVGPASVDGVILVSPGLAVHGGLATVTALCEQYRPLPVCSLGMLVPGVPSVTVDNRTGMSAVVEHVVEVHRRRRIAYLGGPPTNPHAEERFAVFREVLARHGLACDPRLITHANFEHESGAQAVHELVQNGAVFDALVAANDGMAIGALLAFKERGIRVPEDVIVTGYDDVDEAQFTEPALTTVRQPLAALAAAAVDVIVRHLSGWPVAPRLELGSRLVVRHSCGCLRSRLAAGAPPTTSPTGTDEARLPREPRAGDPSEPDTQPPSLADDLVASVTRRLRDALASHSDRNGRFLWAVSQVLDQWPRNDDPCDGLLPILAQLRRELVPASSRELDELWHAAQRSIASASGRLQLGRRQQVEVMYWHVLEAANRFSAALDMRSLEAGLREQLPRIHPRSLFIGLPADEDRSVLRPLLCLRDGVPFTPERSAFPASELLPAEFWPEDGRRTYFVLPLTAGTRQLGWVAIEAHAQSFDYSMLRDQIASSLRVVTLHEEVVRQAALHERSQQERQAAAERMRSLTVLASGVAHDLNNALGSLVALSDVVLDELGRARCDPHHDDTDIQQDLGAIKAGALRAAETIKDLMTLGRRGQTEHTLVELNRAVTAVALDVHAQTLSLGTPQAELSIRTHPEPLAVVGAEAQLMRAVGNLVRNAAEATGAQGTVAVETKPVHLSDPLSAYETIPPGDYAVIVVSDTGEGIPPEHVSRVFEPFFTTKRRHRSSGSGLGLSIVHGVVKDHGGYVDVVSQVGRGTTFSLYLPSATPSELPPKKPPQPCQRGNATILVVDDDAIQLRTAQRVLERLGYRVTTVSSGALACQKLGVPLEYGPGDDAVPANASSEFDIVIMDLALNEEANGLEVYRRIRARYPGQKGILASGHALIQHEDEIRAMGMAWLPKPYTAEALLMAVQSLLGTQEA